MFSFISSRAGRALLGLLCLILLVHWVRGESALSTLDDFGPVSDFSLTERSGKTITRDDLLGKVWIASFVLTRCPDGKCPQVSATIQRLQKELAGRADLRFVTFTVGPEDSPDEVKRYADHFGADPERWLFLSGKEEEIDGLMRAFMVRRKDEPFTRGKLDHSQRLFLVDRQGHYRALVDGLDSPSNPDGYFENNLKRLRRETDELLGGNKLPLPFDFPAFNASLNALSGVLIVVGYLAIRQRAIRLHITCMLTAIAVSAVFLSSYLFFHLVIRGGQPTHFEDQAPGAPPWVKYVYFGILGTHTILAVAAAPLALFTAYQGLWGNLRRHVKVAWWTLPIWLYVSVTGVVVYVMLYRLYP